MNFTEHPASDTTHRLYLRDEPYRLRWQAILAGVAIATAIWILISTLGVAVSLTMVDVDSARSVHHAAIGSGVLGLFAPAIGCYVGAVVVGRSTQFAPHASRAVAGLVMWAVTALIAGLLVGRVASAFADPTNEMSAQATATATGKLLLATVGASALALVASIAGAIVGGRRTYVDLGAPVAAIR